MATLEQCMLDNEDLALCGIILTEILQGIASDTTHRRVRRYLRHHVLTCPSQQTWVMLRWEH
ncbi:MAG: hypothetical protein WBN08_09820 [Thiogranum sp.]